MTKPYVLQKIEELDNSVTTHGVPSGLIAMWSGEATSIPDGWALCDGQNGTPDLRDRFIVGAGGEYSIGKTGGEKEVVLSVEQMPSHRHDNGTLSTNSAGSHSHSGSTNTTGSHTHSYTYYKISTGELKAEGGLSSYTQTTGTTDSAGSHSHNLSLNSAGTHSHAISGNTGLTGGGAAHENRPPYYALAFIMKL